MLQACQSIVSDATFWSLLPLCISQYSDTHLCSVYNEKRISVEAGEGEKTEYRVWNPFRSKLAASVLAGVDNIHIKPGGKVLYLGAASGTSVSHVSDIVGPTGAVFAVEFSHRSGEHLCHCHHIACICWSAAVLLLLLWAAAISPRSPH